MKFPNFFKKKKEEPLLEAEPVIKPKKSSVKMIAKMLFGNEDDRRYRIDKELTPFEKQLGHPAWVSPVDRRPVIAEPKKFVPSKELRIRFARERNLIDKPLRPSNKKIGY